MGCEVSFVYTDAAAFEVVLYGVWMCGYFGVFLELFCFAGVVWVLVLEGFWFCLEASWYFSFGVYDMVCLILMLGRLGVVGRF